jgi:hypothetical protein
MSRNTVLNFFFGRTRVAYELLTAAALFLLFFGMTIAVNWRFSVDLAVLQDVIEIYPFSNEPLLALADNSAVIWLIIQLNEFIEPNSLLRIVYSFAFVAKTLLLLRYFGPSATISLTLLFFFAIDLNQARMSLAISLLLLAWSCSIRGALFCPMIFVAAAAVCHYPAAILITIFYSVARYKYISISIFLGVILAGLAISANPDTPVIRYLAYFESNGDSSAMFFIITALVIWVYWRRLLMLQRLAAVAATIISFLTRDFVNLSGRISELAAIIVLLCAFSFGQRMKEERLIRSEIILLVSIIFFSYRFNQWVIMGNIPIPSNS